LAPVLTAAAAIVAAAVGVGLWWVAGHPLPSGFGARVEPSPAMTPPATAPAAPAPPDAVPEIRAANLPAGAQAQRAPIGPALAPAVAPPASTPTAGATAPPATATAPLPVGTGAGAAHPAIAAALAAATTAPPATAAAALPAGTTAPPATAAAPPAGTTAPSATATAAAAPRRLGLSADKFQTLPRDTIARITVRRSGDLDQPVSFEWWTEPDSAKPDTDYVSSAPTLEHIAAGKDSVRLLVPLVSDPSRRAAKSFYVVIGSPSAGISLATRTRAQVIISPMGE